MLALPLPLWWDSPSHGLFGSEETWTLVATLLLRSADTPAFSTVDISGASTYYGAVHGCAQLEWGNVWGVTECASSLAGNLDGGMSELKPIYELRLMLWAPPACTRRAGTQLSRSGRENTTDSLAAEVQRVGHFNHHLHVYLYATLVNHYLLP